MGTAREIGPSPASQFFIGPAGWTYDDWKGIVFPEHAPRRFDPLVFMAERFNALELNTSFYHIPSVENVRSWCRRVAFHKTFLFAVKLWQGFTHERRWSPADLEQMRGVLTEFQDAGRLGCALLQFPWSFRRDEHNLALVQQLRELFPEFSLAVEIRHRDWHEKAFLHYLRKQKISFVNIDQPHFRDNLPLTSDVTAPIAYLRLHGRNTEHWFREESGPNDRYNYLYPPSEERVLIETARELGQKSQKVFVIANNHFRGQAVANALELQAELTGVLPSIPQALKDRYPQLQRYAFPDEAADEGGEQLSIF